MNKKQPQFFSETNTPATPVSTVTPSNTAPVKPKSTSSDNKEGAGFDFGLTPTPTDRKTFGFKPVGINHLEAPTTPHVSTTPNRNLGAAFEETAQKDLEEAFDGVNLETADDVTNPVVSRPINFGSGQ